MKSKDLQAYQLWQSNAHGTWIHSTPSQIQPPLPTVQVVHIFLCPGLRWWCQPHGPHNAKNQEGDGHPHPRLPSLGVGPQATGSLLLLPVYWGSPYSAVKRKEQTKALNSWYKGKDYTINNFGTHWLWLKLLKILWHFSKYLLLCSTE